MTEVLTMDTYEIAPLARHEYDEFSILDRAHEILNDDPDNGFVKSVLEATCRWPERYPTPKQAWWVNKLHADLCHKSR